MSDILYSPAHPWRAQTEEDWRLAQARARNWTYTPGYPYFADPRVSTTPEAWATYLAEHPELVNPPEPSANAVWPALPPAAPRQNHKQAAPAPADDPLPL